MAEHAVIATVPPHRGRVQPGAWETAYVSCGIHTAELAVQGAGLS